jgi:poly(3-hydroxybutyrate) depolymerase
MTRGARAWGLAGILLTFGLGCGSSSGGGAVADTGLPETGDPLDGAIVQGLPLAGGAGTFAIAGRTESAIEVALPSPMRANAPLVIAFHGTGGEPADGLALAPEAAGLGAIVIAPRAAYRDGVHPADVDHDVDEGGSSWNLWTAGATANEDLRYVLALIASAKSAYGVDTSRVYTIGFSNGAFMAYFTAASLPDAIAGFAESSGGWTTDACPSRYQAISDGYAFQATSGPAPGAAVSCASLYATTSPAFPKQCIPSATNALRPPKPGARVPFGYLAHYSGDDTVSVMWSCFLADALGARAKVVVRFADAGDVHGHAWPPDFFTSAWAFWAGRTNGQ